MKKTKPKTKVKPQSEPNPLKQWRGEMPELPDSIKSLTRVELAGSYLLLSRWLAQGVFVLTDLQRRYENVKENGC